MTMNKLLENFANLGGDTAILLMIAALAVMCASVLRMGRTVSRERRMLDGVLREMRELNERCDLQQLNLTRLGQRVVSTGRSAPAAAPSRPEGETLNLHPARSERVVRVRPQPVRAVQPTQPAVTTGRVAKPYRESAAASKRASTDVFKLARGGATAEEIMSCSGLSRAEAELVISVHGASTAA